MLHVLFLQNTVFQHQKHYLLFILPCLVLRGLGLIFKVSFSSAEAERCLSKVLQMEQVEIP